MTDVPAEPHNHEFTVRQPVEATLGFSASVSSVPLVHVASASVYASGGASQVIVTPRPESPVPTVDASLSKSTWDLTTTGAGVTIGGAIGHVPGAVVGGAVMYAWGQIRWRQVQNKDT
jgi:hypothetical protein